MSALLEAPNEEAVVHSPPGLSLHPRFFPHLSALQLTFVVSPYPNHPHPSPHREWKRSSCGLQDFKTFQR